jgi:hypothetical protein
MKRSTNRSKGNRAPPSGDELPKQDPIPPKPAADQPVFSWSYAKLQYPAAASSEQENVVAMGLRASLARSDISTKLAIAAKTTAS